MVMMKNLICQTPKTTSIRSVDTTSISKKRKLEVYKIFYFLKDKIFILKFGICLAGSDSTSKKIEIRSVYFVIKFLIVYVTN